MSRLDDFENFEKERNTNLFQDTVDAFQAGAARSMGGMASFVGLDSAAEKMNEIANAQYRTMTPESQVAMGKRLINDDLSLGEGFTDGRTWLLNVAQIVGDMAPTILPGGAVGKGVSLAGNAMKAGASVAKVAGAANMGTLVATNLSSAGGQAGLAARDDIMNLSYEDLADSPIFQKLAVSYHKQGMSQEDALSKAQQDIADEVKNRITYDPTMMVINGTLGALGDKAMTKVVSGKLGRTIKGAIGKAIVAEGGTEAAQGAAQRYTQNAEANKAAGGEIYDPTQGVAQEAIEGGILGAVVGGGGGAVGGAVGNVRRRSFEKNVEGIITPQAITDAKAKGLTDGEIRKSFENLITNAALERGFEVDEAETMAKNAVMSAFGEGPTAEQRASMEDAQEQSSQSEDRQRPEGAERRDQMVAEQRASREEPKLEVGEPNPRDFGLKAEDAELLIDPPAELFDSNGNFAKGAPKELKQRYQVAMNRRGAQDYVQAVTDYRYNNRKPYQEELELAQVPTQQSEQTQESKPTDAEETDFNRGIEPYMGDDAVKEQYKIPLDHEPTDAARRIREDSGTALRDELYYQQGNEYANQDAPDIRREREMIAPTEAAQRVRSQLPEFEAEAQRRQQAEESQLTAEQEAETQRERDLNRGFEAQQSFNKEGQKATNQAKQSQVEPTRQIEQSTVYQPRQQTREQVRYEEPAPTAEELIERNRGKRGGVLKGNLGESMPAKRNKRQVKKAKSKLKAAQQTIYDRITKSDPLATNEVEQDFAATTGYTPNSAMMEAFEVLKPTKKEPTPEEVEQRVDELEDSGTVEKADADAIRLQARRDFINEYELPDGAPVWMQKDQDNIDKLKDAQVNKLYEAISNPNTKENVPVKQDEEANSIKQQDAAEKQTANEAAKETNTNPTEAQKEAGNYKKGSFDFHGLTVAIENPKGSERSGTNSDGESWSVTMKNHYGYIKRTEGADGDAVDVFVGPNEASKIAYIIDQVDPKTGLFDEHKVMLGFTKIKDAKKAYLENYTEGWKGFGEMSVVKLDDFKKWLNDGDLSKPYSNNLPEPTPPKGTKKPVGISKSEITSESLDTSKLKVSEPDDRSELQASKVKISKVAEAKAGGNKKTELITNHLKIKGVSDSIMVGIPDGDLKSAITNKAGKIKESDNFLRLRKPEQFESIVMMPPRNLEEKYLSHGVKLIKPGGRVIAVASDFIGDSSRSASVNLREYFDAVGAKEIKNDDGTKTVIINKPEDVASLPIPDDIRFSQSSIVNKAKGFKERLKTLLTSKNENFAIIVSDTPNVLQHLGMKAKELYISKRVINKATVDKHEVPMSILENLPELISDPVAVFKPKDKNLAERGGKNVIIEGKDIEGRPILVAIHADANLGRVKDIHAIKSVHGKKPESLNYWIEDGSLEYIKSKAPEWLDRPGLPLPGTSSSSRIRENTQEPKLSTRQLGHDSHQLAYNPRKLLISSTASDNLIVGDRDLKSNDKTRPAQLGASLVENEAQKWLDGYQGLKAANIQVVEKQSDLSQWVKTDPEATVKGVWLSGDNRVVLVAENLSSMADVRKTLRHELIAHNGLYGNLSSAERDALTNKVMKLRGNAKLKSIFNEVDNSYKNAPDDVKAEEVIARIAESESGKLRQLVDRVMAMVMGALRRSGVLSQEKVTISEVRNMINGVDRYLRRNDGTLSLPNAVRFSQRVDKVQGLDQEYSAVIDGARDNFLNKILSKTLDKSRVIDAMKGFGWSLLTMRQTEKVARKKVSKEFASHINNYMDAVNQMLADEGRATQNIIGQYENIKKWSKKNPELADRTFTFMHDLTLDNVNPLEEYVDMTPELKQAKASLEAQKKSRSGEAKARLLKEVGEIDQQIKNEPRREKIHERRRKEFLALPKGAQDIIGQISDHYIKQREEMTQALLDKAESLKIDGGKKGKAMMLKIRLDNEIAKKGFYVPLARFGDYFVDGTNENGERVFTMFQTENEMKRALARLHAAGFEATHGRRTDHQAGIDTISSSFVTQMTHELDTTVMSEKARAELKDRVYQLYLDTLPSRSIRRQFIHRKGVKGFSNDALQALADQGARQAKQLAKLKHEDAMVESLAALKKEHEDLKNRPQDSEDRVAASRIVEAMGKRHEWVMNPQRAAWASKMTGFGFFMLIGASPASALLNITQNVQVALPVIGSKYGVLNTSREMTRLTGNFFTNFVKANKNEESRRKYGILGSTILKGDERKAMEEAIAMGVIDTTQTHDLIGLAENPTDEITGRWATTMRYVGWMFHHAEVLNREVTFMTAYRMAKNAGESHNDAKKYAVDATWESHFDYGSLNRAAFMQKDVPSVALQFKQYSQNMTFFLVHNFLQAFAVKVPKTDIWFSTVSKNTTAAERSMARKQLMGTMAATFLIGGLGAMPMATLAAIANMAHSIVGDDDDPWDAETELKGALADMFGEDLADGMYYGLGTMVGLPNVSSRIEIDPKSLWFRDSYSLEAQGSYKEQMFNLLGPVAGIGGSFARGLDYVFRDNKYWEGFESFSPKWVRDVSKTARYLSEGSAITNRQGDVVVADLSPLEYAEQLLGFTPSRQLVQGAKNRAYKDYERQIMDRRKLLMNSMWQTYRTNDVEGMKNVWKRIDKFNKSDWGRLNPITQKTVNQSMRIRARGQSKAKNGIRINDKYISQLNAMYAAN
ncbi:PLxRFG domain-containing protein [Vibrio sp. ER1A]|uniref:PLxRFG domain-containing protein n=1 Tax=Vibrio sp. ER1A TaxID=1517681 RepID=UPI0004DD2262|nr:PLxRFG domain-containing protein [Vibrio sp. ER1A]KFA99612.1 hypothetical protein HW45_02690 [Vibrio sp. ER1A]